MLDAVLGESIFSQHLFILVHGFVQVTFGPSVLA